MHKRLMILGASRYYIRSIISAKEFGCEVVVIDKNPKAEGFKYADYHEAVDITNIEAALKTAKKYAVNGVIPLNDFGVLTAAYISKELGLPGISIQAASYAINKAHMRQVWKEKNVPSAEFRIVSSIEEACKAVKELNSWPLILKPADSRGGGSRGVSCIHSANELAAALEFAQEFYEDKNVVIETFLEGSEHSVESITYDGITTVLAISDNIKLPMPYRVNKSLIYPTISEEYKVEQIREAAKMAVNALDIKNGPTHIEMCFTSGGPRLFEIGARCGGGGIPDPIVPYVTGVDMFKEVIRIALGENPKHLIPKNQKACVYRFLTPSPGKIKKIENIDKIKYLKNILDFAVLVNQGDTVKRVRIGSDRSGFIIAGGNTRETAIRLADDAENMIKFVYHNEFMKSQSMHD